MPLKVRFPIFPASNPEDGAKELSDIQAEQLRDTLRSVTGSRIDTSDYSYTYNEKTGDCSLVNK